MKLKLKRIGTVLVTTILMTAALGKPCTADGKSPVIDTNAKGTLTIYKISENNGAVYEGNGKKNDALDGRGISGALFEMVKIGDISMAADNSEGVSGAFTSIDEDFLGACISCGVTVSADISGENSYWYTDKLVNSLQNVLASARISDSVPGDEVMRSYVSGKSSKIQLAATDTTGKTEVGNLDLGLYLVAEVGSSSGSDSGSSQSSGNPSSPFLVSVPMSAGDESDSNTYWLYDVTVYPKVQNITVPKYIVGGLDGKTLMETADYEIGETVHQVIAPTVPVADTAGNKGYDKYVVKDTMDQGLSVVGVTAVKLGSWVADPSSTDAFSEFTTLIEGTDYSVYKGVSGTDFLTRENAHGNKAFRVELLPDGLTKINALEQCGQLVVFFDSVVTKDASAGDGNANVNTPTLTVKRRGSTAATFTGNSPAVYTYRLNIDKVGVTDFSKVSFSVSRGDTQLQFMKDSDGVYHLFDNDTEISTQAVTAVTPDGQGHLALKGLDATTYKITEQSTQSGMELLKSAFEVSLTAKNPVDGELQTATLSAGGMSTTLTVDKGTASMKVQNRSALVLRTGGTGVIMIYVGAIALFGMALVLTVMKAGRKEK